MDKNSLEIKYFAVALSALLIIGGLYFKFLYDVPDGEEKTNNLGKTGGWKARAQGTRQRCSGG